MHLPCVWRVATLLGTVAFCLAQTAAYEPRPAGPSPNSAWAWDSDRGRLVAVEATPPYLWDWDGSEWSSRQGVPSGAGGSFAAYDPVRRVLLAGAGTSEWDGARWTLRGPNTIGVGIGGLTFDLARRRVVLPTSTGANEWDGVQWHTLVGASGPEPRIGGAFAYDPVRRTCVLYGGASGVVGETPYDDCWSWDGASWTQLVATAPPGPRRAAVLAHEPATGQMVLYGGGGTTTWRLAGSTWTQVLTTRDPGERVGAKLVFDGRGLLLGGGDPIRSGELWRFENGDWTPIPVGIPIPRRSPDLGYDPVRRQVVMHGGLFDPSTLTFLDDTWTFDGQWRRHRPPISPSGGAGVTMAWSVFDQALLLCVDAVNLWAWDGAVWTLRTPTTTPPPRLGFALQPDPFGGVMLFGGASASAVFADQWLWNGVGWLQVSQAAAPGPRAPFSVHDPRRNVVVLWGSTLMPPALRDTWEWDGLAWRSFGDAPFTFQILPSRMVWNPATGRTRAEMGQAFEWDGAVWTSVGPLGGVQVGTSFVADVDRGHVLRVASPLSGFAVLTAALATASPYGNGCAFGPVPGLLTAGRPTPGNAMFALTSATFAPGAPAFVVLGLQAQNQPLGSGCSALVGSVVDVQFVLTSTGGEARLPLPLPNDLTLRGVGLTAQAVVLDPARSVLAGITLSSGLSIAIGD